jgi:gliding motility-associated-like protein
LTTLDAGADQTVCEGDEVTLLATGASVYEWSDGVSNGAPFPAALGSSTYTVTGTDANGCENEQSISITGTPYPDLIFEFTNPECQGDPSGNAVALASNGTDPYSFVWSNGVLLAENNGIAAGTYEVTVTDGIGCETSATIVVVDPTEPCFSIPGALSPNGDGINETWAVGGLSQYPDAKVSVFNRWGQQVYTGNYATEPWDGSYDGENLPTADYYYILDLGNGETYNGVVTLKR